MKVMIKIPRPRERKAPLEADTITPKADRIDIGM
jgi:hypothetical protein